ncbi:NAD(P)/FAD-dependent oxidoreductase [Nonomuraea sp. NPDC049400]|uniref:NAD(P)/FAD-dependent oxidoreductase n=1 Tax=Nonomuraea sp. NPDC049400 TaxID=3364352 RepID=UPI00378F0596
MSNIPRLAEVYWFVGHLVGGVGDVDRIVLVGASLASVHAIDTLRSNDYAGEIVLVGAESQVPYDRPPLSKEALRTGHHVSPLRGPEWYADRGVRLELGRAARGLRPATRTVVLEDGHELSYDGLVIATGSRVRRLRHGDEHICYLRTADDAAALRERLRAATRVAVIGGGFLGLEVAATATELGVHTTVIEVAPVPMARVLGDEVGEWFRRLHERHGVAMLCGRLATGVDRVGEEYVVSVPGREPIRADLVVGALGAVPVVDWLAGSGVAVSDGVVCDFTLRTTVPDVVAAGDVARWYNPLFDEDMRVEQWTNAAEQGRHAALTLLGAEDAYAPVPYFWSDQFDAKMRFVGRATAADEIDIENSTDRRLVATFARHGHQIGALCVNAPTELPRHRAAIAARSNLSSRPA